MPSPTIIPSMTIPRLNDTINGTMVYYCNEFGALHYTLTAVIIIFGLTANGFMCVAFAIRRKLRTVTNYFVVNLAVADFLLIVEWMILVICYLLCVETGLNNFPVTQTMDILFGTASVISLAMVSFDRYFAVTRALHYNTTMTHSRALIAIIAIWIYSTLTSFLIWGRLDHRKKEFMSYRQVYISILFVLNFIIPFVISMFCYFTIFMIALSHLRHSAGSHPADPNSSAAITRKQLRITFHIVILAVPFLLIWNVFYGITVYEISCLCQLVTDSVTAEFVISNLPQLVAAINPVIFICMTKDFRSFARTCCRCLLKKRNHDRLTLTETYPISTQYTSNFPSNGGEHATARL